MGANRAIILATKVHTPFAEPTTLVGINMMMAMFAPETAILAPKRAKSMKIVMFVEEVVFGSKIAKKKIPVMATPNDRKNIGLSPIAKVMEPAESLPIISVMEVHTESE